MGGVFSSCAGERSKDDVENSKRPAEYGELDESLNGTQFIASSNVLKKSEVKSKEEIARLAVEKKRSKTEPIQQEILTYIEEGKLAYQEADKMIELKGGKIDITLGKEKYEEAIQKFVSAMKLSKQMYTFGKDNNDKMVRHKSRIFQGRALGCIALVYEKQCRYPESILQCEDALTNFKKVKTYDDVYYKVFVLDTLWRCYWKQHNYDDAMKYSEKCISLMTKSFPDDFADKIRRAKKVILAMRQKMVKAKKDSATGGSSIATPSLKDSVQTTKEVIKEEETAEEKELARKDKALMVKEMAEEAEIAKLVERDMEKKKKADAAKKPAGKDASDEKEDK